MRDPQATRERLIEAALELFGAKGFSATSTREIAKAAGTNIGSITYHFGGKAGLQMACAEMIADRLASIRAALPDLPGDAGPDAALEQIRITLGAIANFLLLRPDTEHIAAFMFREVQEAGDAFALVYRSIIEPMHIHICELWSAATGAEAASERTRIAMFTLIGQIFYFRIGREIVLRRMEWPAFGHAQAEIIRAQILDNLDAMAERERARHAGAKPQ
jgi:TetR/AcrR family transcriptional regulator, regulator of cefoperazone and chloramphenicol sensitivity